MILDKNISVQILIFLILSSCQNNARENSTKIKDVELPVIIDTFDISKQMQYFDDENPTWLSTASYDIFYIGKYSDTIYIDPFMNFSGFPKTEDSFSIEKRPLFRRKHEIYLKYHIEWPIKSKFKNWDESKFEILVDTQNLINNYIPIFIKNIEFDTVNVGYGNILPVIMEAMDSTGNWRPIQERFFYMCGNGVGTIILPPKEIVLTFAPIFKGDYKTELRIAIGENHSLPYKGSIHYRQVKSKFGENGDYCEEYKKEYKSNNH